MSNEDTRTKIAGTQDKPMGDRFAKYQNEMNSIRRKARVESDKITVHEIVDHKNISLWTKWGKRIGPMHRDNALKAFDTFWNMGIELSTDQPAQADIDAYWASDEGKAHQKAHEEKRAIKNKSRKSGQIEKLAKEIAAMSGMTVDAINKVFAGGRPLDEGRAGLPPENTKVNLDNAGVGGVKKDGEFSNIKPE